jgi:NAD+-dependent secondary alcohol dehydrogenase Adh1
VRGSDVRYIEISPGEVRLQHGDRPDLPPGWARVRVNASAVCGTDIHMFEGMDLPPGVEYPVRPGHEVAGTVIEVNGHPTPVAVNSPVVLHPLAPCGICVACVDGREQQCPDSRILGVDTPGGLADEVVWPADRLVPVPGIEPFIAALLPDAVATAWHAYRATGLSQGGSLIVLGAGGVGTHLLQLCKVVNPTASILAVVRSESTANRVRALGIDCLVGLEGAARVVRKRVGEVDAVADFTGSSAAPAEGIRMLRRGGRLVLGSIVDEATHLGITTTAAVTRELQMVGSFASTIEDLHAVARLTADGALDLHASASLRMALDEADEAFRIVQRRPPGHIRLVLEP